MELASERVRVLLADDNIVTRRRTVELIRRHEFLELTEVITSLEDLKLRLIASPMAEVALTNVRLGGVPVFNTLSRVQNRPPLILVSRERDFAPEAFEIRALDYLLMPLAPRRFARAMDRAVRRALQRRENNTRSQKYGLFLYKAGEYNLIRFEQILYLRSDKKGTRVETTGQFFHSRRHLGDVGGDLPDHMFRRIHRQYIVNVSRISSVKSVPGGRYVITLNGTRGETLPVGARYASALLQFMKT